MGLTTETGLKLLNQFKKENSQYCKQISANSFLGQGTG